MMNPEIDNFLQEVLKKETKTDLSRLIEYERFCGRADGHSLKTIDLKILALNKLRKFLQENGFSTDVSMLGTQEIRKFIVYLRDVRRFDGHPYAGSQAGNLSEHTINDYLRSIRAAWNHWVFEGIIDACPFDKVKIPKAPQRIIPTFNEDQLRAFFGSIDTSTPEGFRDFTLYQLYIDTACRLSEGTGARLNKLNLKERSLSIIGKGNKERIVPLGVNVSKLLLKYIQFYRPDPAIPGCDLIFLTKDGRPRLILRRNPTLTLLFN